MLTWPDLETHVVAGRLIRWTHDGKASPADGRALYMVPEVYEGVQNRHWPASDGERPAHTADRRAAMRAVLRRYVVGDALLIRRDLKELGSPIDGAPNVRMRGYWEFRSQGRMEETRLFGFFARPGAFVATAFKARGEFRKGMQSDWNAQREKCGIEWHRVFADRRFLSEPWPMLTRDQMSAYLERYDG